MIVKCAIEMTVQIILISIKKRGSLTNEYFRIFNLGNNSCSTSNRVFDREEEAMSIVAWDGKTLAADRQRTTADTISTSKKLCKLDDGTVVAWVGNISYAASLLSWYKEGAKKEDWPEFQKGDEWVKLIIVNQEGCFFYERTPEKMEVFDPFAAWGVGREAALGAMEMGADAVKAVEVASKYISGCGRGCDYVMVKQKSFKIVDYDKPLKKCKYVEGW
jgi:hypothetical protein